MSFSMWMIGVVTLIVALVGPEVLHGKDDIIFTIVCSAIAIGVWIQGATYAVLAAIRPKTVEAAESD